MKIIWITGGGFIIEHFDRRLIIDPYLSNIVEKTMCWTRLVSAPVKLKDLKPDIVFSTHKHIDHLDPEAIPEIAEYYPLCLFIGPKSVRSELIDMGIDSERITKLDIGMKVEMLDFKLIATPADHSDKHSVGVIVEVSKKKIYISGDTRYSTTLAKDIIELSNGDIDLALVCINGNYNNMNSDEAFSVIKEIQPKIAAPMHYGLFAENTEDPLSFINKCVKEGIKTFLFTAGKPVELEKILKGEKI